RYESEPFWCNEHGMFGRWRNEYLEEMDLTDFRKRSLCHAAIMVPIHLPFGQIGSVSFTPLDKDLTDLSEPFEKHADLMAAMTRRFIAGYVMVMRTKRRIPADCMLSKREVECLRWAAIGKTDKEISMILDRSHATIRYHIHRAGEKLDAVNRSQTIFKAGQPAYLSPEGERARDHPTTLTGSRPSQPFAASAIIAKNPSLPLAGCNISTIAPALGRVDAGPQSA
ncbi:MAG: helix-turn-helix transcriptional regulator, partial [Sphingopyxis sp.]|uniref:helix-turn-helix transcriptional regulator n=1 Tax=Sphingopyxis sp. TaxID=1908224 RepID=UPI0040350A80